MESDAHRGSDDGTERTSSKRVDNRDGSQIMDDAQRMLERSECFVIYCSLHVKYSRYLDSATERVMA